MLYKIIVFYCFCNLWMHKYALDIILDCVQNRTLKDKIIRHTSQPKSQNFWNMKQTAIFSLCYYDRSHDTRMLFKIPAVLSKSQLMQITNFFGQFCRHHLYTANDVGNNSITVDVIYMSPAHLVNYLINFLVYILILEADNTFFFK